MTLTGIFRSIFYGLFILLSLYDMGQIIHDLWLIPKEGSIIFLNTYVRILQDFIFGLALLGILRALWQFIYQKTHTPQEHYFRSAYALFRGIVFKNSLIALPLAFFETQHSVFSNFIHPWLFRLHVFSLFSSQPENLSSEYSRIFFFIAIILIYLAHWVRGQRHYKIIFINLSMCGVLGTAMLFHVITLKQLDYFTQSQQSFIYSFLKDTTKETLEAKCEAARLTCYIESAKNTQRFLNRQDFPDFVKRYLPVVTPHIQNPYYFYYVVSSNTQIMDRLQNRTPIAFIKNPAWISIVIDSHNYPGYLAFNQTMFGILAMASHVVWIFGGLYPIYFHEKRRHSRITKQSNMT